MLPPSKRDALPSDWGPFGPTDAKVYCAGFGFRFNSPDAADEATIITESESQRLVLLAYAADQGCVGVPYDRLAYRSQR